MTKAKATKTKGKRMTIMSKRAWWGRLFVLPWVIGVFWFFVVPMVQTVYYSLNTISVSKNGLTFRFVGVSNYVQYLFQSADFPTNYASTLESLCLSIPLIVCFSLFVALVLASKFRGRTFFRAVFFFPVIIASGVVINILTTNLLMSTSGVSSTQPAYMFQAPDLGNLFTTIGVPTQMVTYINNLVSEVFDLTWKSGVQILLLLAAINGIPGSFYEVAEIEGATEWEKFWKITLPTVLPTLLVAVIYTIIDSFTDASNEIMQMIKSAFANVRYENAATIGVLYFATILVIVGLVNFIMNKFISYSVD